MIGLAVIGRKNESLNLFSSKYVHTPCMRKNDNRFE